MIIEKRQILKSEIEEALRGKDDFIKIDYLRRFLNQADNLEVKKFILINLANISEGRNLLKDAVKYLSGAGDISITPREKIEFYMKEAELWIKLKEFEQSEKAFKKAYFYGNLKEKLEMQKKYNEIYWIVAGIEEKNGRLRNAIKIYEKAIHLNEDRKFTIYEKLIFLYDQVGDIKMSNTLRDKIDKQKGF